MAFSFGFYNALNHDRRYNAVQMSQIFDGLISDGVYATYENAFVVKASTEDNTVVVQSGRAWFDHTWNYNDADLPVVCDAANIILDRWDAIVIDINSNEQSRTNAIIAVSGTPSSNPEKPTMIKTVDHTQYPLCYIYRKANVATINQEDITNTVGTSECPFVTGIIDTISTDQLVKQWSDQWAQFVKNYEQTASEWGAAQQLAFTQYVNEFKLQMAEFKQESSDEFQTWFDNLVYVLDGDVAGHLQNEIDELKEEGLSGSIITITTSESTLIGKTVTMTGPETSKSGVFDSNKQCQFTGFKDIGTISIESTDGSQTAHMTTEIPYFANYKYTIAFWAATIHITTSSEDLYGKTITVFNSDGEAIGTTVFSNSGNATYTVVEPGTYTVSITVEDTTYTEECIVTEQATYEVTLETAHFVLEEWIQLSGSDAEYTTLDEVLKDEFLVRRLFTRHASVDYLVLNGAAKDDPAAILNSDIAAKWVTRRHYALTQLKTNTKLLKIMNDSGKYTGKWTNVDGTWQASGDLPTTDTTPDTIRYYEHYGYKDDFSDKNPATRITYLEDTDNATHEKMLTNEGTGTATAGSWADFLSTVLENTPAMVTKDGVVDYYLDPDDYTKKLDGTVSDYANTSYNGGAFAWISRMYMRETYASDDNSRNVEFVAEDLEGFTPVGFTGPDGTLREGVWLPMGYMDASGRTLVSGTTPVASKTCDQEKAIIDGWATGQADGVFLGGAMLNFLRDLEYMLYKSTDIQLTGGHGRCNAGSQKVVNNAVVANGPVRGFKGTNNKTTMNKAFHSQLLFSYQQWIRDPYTILINGSLRVSPNYVYNLGGTGYINTGKTFSTSSGWSYPCKMQKVADSYGSTFVQENTGSTDTGYCDGGYWNASGTRVALRLGNCDNDLMDGPARLFLNYEASFAYWSIGVGLLLLPSAGYKPSGLEEALAA